MTVITGTDNRDVVIKPDDDVNFVNLLGGDDFLFIDGIGTNVNMGSGNDKIIAKDAYSIDSVFLGDGDDIFIGIGNTTGRSVEGGDGNDLLKAGSAGLRLSGGNGDDTLIGGPGNDDLIDDLGLMFNLDQGDDLMIGGGGNDNLYFKGGDDVGIGGPGEDYFRFNLIDSPFDDSMATDVVVDFTPGKDTLVFNASKDGPFQNFDDLDTNGNGVLDDGDDHVTIQGGTTIDFSSAYGNDPGTDTVTILGEQALTEADFVWFLY